MNWDLFVKVVVGILGGVIINVLSYIQHIKRKGKSKKMEKTQFICKSHGLQYCSECDMFRKVEK